jgi:hypothetical protein
MEKQQIEQIKNAVNLKQLMTNNGVAFRGNQALCPFHEEKTPSFSVYPNTNSYKCFSCGASGDAISYYQHAHGLGFVDAVKELGESVGISVDTNISRKFENDEDPKAAAKHYLKTVRGLSVNENLFSQETFASGGKTSATVRFQVDDGVFWERIIDDSSFDRKANFRGSYKGKVWKNPTIKIPKNTTDEIYITEGIFDAIALNQATNKITVSAMSTSNYPMEFIEQHPHATFCIALDYGTAGTSATKKWVKELKAGGKKYKVFTPHSTSDWNDLFKQNKLNGDYLQSCYFKGMQLISNSANEKYAWRVVESRVCKNDNWWGVKTITFDNSYYQCQVDEKTLVATNAQQVKEAIDVGDFKESVNLLISSIKTRLISTATANLLYTQYDLVDKSFSYYFDVATKGVKDLKQIEVGANHIADAASFDKTLISKVGQATFLGDNQAMKDLRMMWFAKRKPTIETVRHQGYSVKHKAYIFNDFGYKNGRKYIANKQNYIQIGGEKAVKTTFNGWHVPIEGDTSTQWFDDLDTAGGNNAITGLAFWLMSLFAQQVRAVHKNIPFWEFTGLAGSGKSTIIEFLWQLFGRDDYEGEDPEKMSFVSLARTMMQASNIPVVLLEGDRDTENHRKKLSMDSLKTLFRGQSPYSRALKNNGIETDNEPFYGTIVISQNAAIDGEPQILTRIVQCWADKSNLNKQTYEAAKRLKKYKTEEVCGFMHSALKREIDILSTYKKYHDKYLQALLQKDEIKEPRIAENHAQLMAFGKALQLLVPEFDNERLKNWLIFMSDLAISRQSAINGDHPLVSDFWDLYDDYNEMQDEHGCITERLNHNYNTQKIAINLNHAKEFFHNKGHYIDIPALKKLLKNSKRYKFIKQTKVKSSITNKSVHCWVFDSGVK